MPIKVTLTGLDMMDLGAGHTINVMDENDGEHILGGADLAVGQFERLERGEPVEVGELELTFVR